MIACLRLIPRAAAVGMAAPSSTSLAEVLQLLAAVAANNPNLTLPFVIPWSRRRHLPEGGGANLTALPPPLFPPLDLEPTAATTEFVAELEFWRLKTATSSLSCPSSLASQVLPSRDL